MSVEIIQGDCIEAMRDMPENSIDSVVTDPPYGIRFMGKAWDAPWIARMTARDEQLRKHSASFRASRTRGGSSGFGTRSANAGQYDRSLSANRKFQEWTEAWAGEAFRVLKPGGHMLVCGSPRTYHRMASGVEDAGFEIRDCINWCYGCLSEDTEILTADGWEPYQNVSRNTHVLAYNIEHDTYQWEPVEKRYVYDYNDTAYRIHSDNTDQLVSRNHRCIVERGGNYVFELAEEAALQREARVPVLEGVRELLRDICNLHQGAGSQEQDMLAGMCGAAHKQSQEREAQATAASMRVVQERVSSDFSSPQEGQAVLFSRVLRSVEKNPRASSRTHQADSLKGTRGLDRGELQVLSREDERREQPGVEGWGNLLQKEGQLQERQIRSLSQRIPCDGAQRWLCDGASANSGASLGTATLEKRGSTSYRPQSGEQQPGELATVREQPGPQAVRASRYTRSDMVRIDPVHYVGKVWCVKVPSGAFVARRNGKIFVTGNSGFPKGLDVSKQIDKMGGKSISWFGPWLRGERERRGITQKELARHFPSKTGGLTGCVANWELGLNIPTVEQFNTLCEVLELPFERLEEAEREVVGKSGNGIAGGTKKHAGEDGVYGFNENFDITAPATDAAKKWQGWNVALKPAHEPIVVARKPLSEKSIAANVLAHGTGALNIDASRIACDDHPGNHDAGGNGEGRYNWNSVVKKSGPTDRVPTGRWPANLILQHSPSCVRKGMKRVKPSNGSAKVGKGGYGGRNVYGGDADWQRYVGFTHTDPDGYETVEEWDCDEGSCPVAEMDRQWHEMGGHAAGNKRATNCSTSSLVYEGGWQKHSANPDYYPSGAGPSRFFLNLEAEPGFIYCAKASKKERDRGLEGATPPLRLRDDLTPEEREYVRQELIAAGVSL